MPVGRSSLPVRNPSGLDEEGFDRGTIRHIFGTVSRVRRRAFRTQVRPDLAQVHVITYQVGEKHVVTFRQWSEPCALRESDIRFYSEPVTDSNNQCARLRILSTDPRPPPPFLDIRPSPEQLKGCPRQNLVFPSRTSGFSTQEKKEVKEASEEFLDLINNLAALCQVIYPDWRHIEPVVVGCEHYGVCTVLRVGTAG